ncbi:MAG: RHS repeat-associated core domain-containing protein, partial [Acidobacteriota bacterium]
DASQDDRALKFTGHERDGNGSAGPGRLDYMHARYCSPGLGRFLNVDPANAAALDRPQTLNRYVYGQNNPTRLLDPDGRSAVSFGIKLLLKGGDVGLTAAGIVQDYRTLTGADSSLGDRVLAGASILSEALPISGRDAVELGNKVAALGARLSKRTDDPTSAAARARELHQAVPRATQDRTTIAVTETREGIRVISSSEKRLRPAQRRMLLDGEIEAIGLGHAEVTGVRAAREAGLNPVGTAASRDICSECENFLFVEAVEPLSRLKSER